MEHNLLNLREMYFSLFTARWQRSVWDRKNNKHLMRKNTGQNVREKLYRPDKTRNKCCQKLSIAAGKGKKHIQKSCYK